MKRITNRTALLVAQDLAQLALAATGWRRQVYWRAAMGEMLGWHAQGRLHSDIHGRHALGDFAAALAALSAREVIGRVVLNPLTEPEIRRDLLR